MRATLKFFRDLLVVVAGIAVTLYATNWITQRNEKRDMKLYLNAIKLELERNVQYIDYFTGLLQNSVKFSNYLQNNDRKSLNKDSIDSYSNDGGLVYYQLSNLLFKRNAFEMFKNSGLMRLMDDKELLQSIWDTYSPLDNLKTFLDMGLSKKKGTIGKRPSNEIRGKTG